MQNDLILLNLAIAVAGKLGYAAVITDSFLVWAKSVPCCGSHYEALQKEDSGLPVDDYGLWHITSIFKKEKTTKSALSMFITKVKRIWH